MATVLALSDMTRFCITHNAQRHFYARLFAMLTPGPLQGVSASPGHLAQPEHILTDLPAAYPSLTSQFTVDALLPSVCVCVNTHAHAHVRGYEGFTSPSTTWQTVSLGYMIDT